MRENRVKKVMREGKLALGTYVTFADPQIVEIIGLAGYDAAFIDMEHTDFDLRLVGEMIRAADLAGVTSIVRVPDNDEKLILRILDAGAEGIIVPHVDGLAGAQRAVEAVRYAPLGHRGGAGGTRAAGYGSIGWDEHVRSSNEQILLSVMTEDEKGVNDIEAIAALDGVDLVSIGPTDFSEYMGIRDPQSPELRAKLDRVGRPHQGHRQGQDAVPDEPRGHAVGTERIAGVGRGLHARGPGAAGGAAAVAAGAFGDDTGGDRVG